jgi:O-antigen ligase
MTNSISTSASSVQNRVRFLDDLFFLLLFSGPPTFRVRDTGASLYGEIDLAIIVQLLVWGLAGIWVFYNLAKMRSKNAFRLQFKAPHLIAIVLILLLGTSVFVSLAPPLTAVKVYQIAVEFLFTWIFVQRYGYDKSLNRILRGSVILCLLITIGLLVAPDFVMDISETGFFRLRGGITGTNTVSAFAIILLLCCRRRISSIGMGISFIFFSLLQFFSLTRASWLALALVFLIAFIKRPDIRGLKWVYATIGFCGIALLAGALTPLNQLRDPDSVYDLSDRLGLWAYMTNAVLGHSPWLGLGYTAATRQLGMEFHPDFGSGHSIFFDVFIGGGIVSLAVFILLFLVLAYYLIKLLRTKRNASAFAACSLFLYILIMGSVGESIDSGPFGFTVWTLVSLLPLLATDPASEARPVESRIVLCRSTPMQRFPQGLQPDTGNGSE